MDGMPEWTEPADKRGLDPLGMQNSGILLYQDLLPGISNVTLRMRYYGFYCWLSDAYGQHEGSTDPLIWQRWVRRGEALFALVAARAGGSNGVGGIEWATNRLALEEAVIDFADEAAAPSEKRGKPYLRQAMGVFGGAYLTQMVEMGLFEDGSTGGHSIPRRSPESGLGAASAYRAAIGEAVEEMMIEKIRAAIVTPTELDAMAGAAPSAIAPGSPECALYEDVLFARAAKSDSSDVRRRRTLQLVLQTAQSIGRRPDPDQVRWYLFAGAGGGLDGQLEEQRRTWEAYQAQDLFQLGAAGLLAWALGLMHETVDGISLDELKTEAAARLTEADPVNAACSWVNYRAAIGANGPKFENWAKAVSDRRHASAERAWTAVSLLAALHQRIDDDMDLGSTIDARFRARGETHARSIYTELEWLRRHEAKPVAGMIADYLAEQIVRRHNWVALQKLRRQKDYTYLFENRDGRLARRADYIPVATTPRLAPAIQFLWDIAVIDENGPTDRGLALLAEAA